MAFSSRARRNLRLSLVAYRREHLLVHSQHPGPKAELGAAIAGLTVGQAVVQHRAAPCPAMLRLVETRGELRAAADAARGSERRSLVGDLKWARADLARLLQADPDARRVAERLADDGDPDAAAAVKLADTLPPDRPPLSADPGQSHRISHTPINLKLDRLARLLARLRDDGYSFPAAWSLARRELGLQVGQVAQALTWSREAWRSAYEREPAPCGYALVGWPAEGPRGRIVAAGRASTMGGN